MGLLGPQSALLFGGIRWSCNEGLSTEHQQPWGRGGEPLGAGRNPSKGTGGGEEGQQEAGSQTFPALTTSLQRSSELPKGEADDTQGMQEGRESGQGVSKEVQGEQKGAVAFPSDLPPRCAGGRRAEGLRGPGAGGAQQATALRLPQDGATHGAALRRRARFPSRKRLELRQPFSARVSVRREHRRPDTDDGRPCDYREEGRGEEPSAPTGRDPGRHSVHQQGADPLQEQRAEV